jgi:ubiquinone/menaquinone biosynthesis C-methylase UbiE
MTKPPLDIVSTLGFSPDPAMRMAQLVAGFRAARAVFVAAELGVFEAVERSDGTLDRIAAIAELSSRGARVLLHALVAAGFLDKDADRYRNTDFARACLLEAGPRTMAHNLRYQEALMTTYASLGDTLRNGEPSRDLLELVRRHQGFASSYARAMLPIAVKPAGELAGALELGEASEILDVGGGAGSYSLAFLARSPSAKATILDLPEVVEIAKQLSRESAHGDRLRFISGDYRATSFGEQAYDLVLFSHVLHDEGPAACRELIRKAHRCLRPGGCVVVHDFLLPEDGTSPAFQALLSLHFLSYTQAGQVYEEALCRRWLEDQGFRVEQRIDVCSSDPTKTVALVGRKV